MPNASSTDLSLLRRRLLAAMRLGPAVLSASLVAACAVPQSAEDSTTPEIGPSDTTETEAWQQLEKSEDARQAPVPMMFTWGTVHPGHVVYITVHGLWVNSQVDVAYGVEQGDLRMEDGTLYEIGDATVVATGVADDEGRFELRFQIPADLDTPGIRLQASVTTPDGQTLRSEVVNAQFDDPSLDHPNATEIHPHTQTDNLIAGVGYRVCIPAEQISADSACTPLADFHEWQALEITDYSLDRPLPADLNARACVIERGFIDECCYGVELFDAVTGPPLDICTGPEEWANQGGGGGGGGGGGWFVEGRPFATGDGVRRAGHRATTGWCQSIDLGTTPPPRIRQRVVDHWIGVAQDEHASVASFSRFNLELMALGAPSELLARSTRALADEIRHARQAFGIASHLAGYPVGPGPLSIDGSLERSTDPKAVLVAAIVEGCINETVCAVFALEAGRRADSSALQAAMDDIATDELRHAELSWAFVRWLLVKHPELRDAAVRAFSSYDPGPEPDADPDTRELNRWGVLTARDKHRLAAEVVATVVMPCARALLERPAVQEATC